MASKSEQWRKEELNKIFSLNLDQLNQALSYFSNVKIDTVKPSLVKEQLSKFMAEDIAKVLVRATCSILFAERSTTKLSVEKLLANYSPADIDTDQIEEKKNALSNLLRTEKASALSKAVFLSFESENIFNSISSVVDVRPIFNLEKTEIVGNIIVPELKIAYIDRNNSEARSITFCTDEEDLSKLADALSEVIRKIKILKSTLGKSNDQTPFMVAGDTEL